MCGIVGYIGSRPAADYLIEGLSRLEYRGYDSAGIATIERGALTVVKRAGRLENLVHRLAESPILSPIGIGHTRWATHGSASDVNAHPHLGGDSTVAVVHNGVIENFRALKTRLESEGYCFRSATDSEVIAHLVADCLEEELSGAAIDRTAEQNADHDAGIAERHRPLVRAVRRALAQLQGTYGLAILFRDYPDVII
ncbi:MAG TPA: glutamine--fructose-6-phosphate aminotransferase, partial [Pirellulales bacterium]|nr:glutamine--fructose-6-phosphate aminotransferase [Pirellulales bacterium]